MRIFYQHIASMHVAWLYCWQGNSDEVKHYTDGLHGCGNLLEKRLQEVYFDILQNLAQILEETKQMSVAFDLLKGFNCKFKASDF